MKIRPAGAELFRADGRTELAKLIVAFRNFAKVPKNVYIYKGSLDLGFSVLQ